MKIFVHKNLDLTINYIYPVICARIPIHWTCISQVSSPVTDNISGRALYHYSTECYVLIKANVVDRIRPVFVYVVGIVIRCCITKL